jgi:RimJ/RimL family protein N-acetyltransferase
VQPRIDWWPAQRLAELQAFIDEYWRRGHVLARDRELLRWQHRRRDDPDRLSVLVAEQPDGRIVGMLGFVPFDACVYGARHRGGWMTNWLVVPELRGHGVGLALVRHALDTGLDFVGALVANEATRRALPRLGFTEVGMARWVRVFSADALELLLGERAGSYPAAAWAAWREQAGAGSPSVDGSVRGWEDEERWNLAWRRRFAPRVVGACRDTAHVRWRFLEHPRFRYELLVAEGSVAEPLGFAAYRIEAVRDTDARIMRIVDLLGDGEQATASLAAALAEAARANDVVLADFHCTSARFGEPLAHAGFELEHTLPAALPARFQPLDFSDRPAVCSFWASPRVAPSGEALFNAPELYVTRSDSDLDRPN